MSDIKIKVMNNVIQKKFDKSLDSIATNIAEALELKTNFCYNSSDLKYILLYYKPVKITKDFIIPAGWLYIKCNSDPSKPHVHRRVDCLDIFEDIKTVYRLILDDIGKIDITFNSDEYEL